MILAGDIGATRTRLAAFQTEGNRLNCVVQKIYPSQEHSGLLEVLREFIRTEGIPVHSACFGVAGPVRGGKSKISNLPWTIDCKELAAQLKLNSVGLLNDLEAYAYGIDALESKDFVTLSEGLEDAEGNRAVISAKTGLGMAGLFWDGFRHHPFACEGGHADFAPRNELQAELFSYLQKKFGHVSCERVLSGPGIRNIYDFLRDTKKAEEPPSLRDQAQRRARCVCSDRAACACGQCSYLRSDDGYIRQHTRGGDWKLRIAIHDHRGHLHRGCHRRQERGATEEAFFLQAFLDKGRMASLLKDMPVKVILNDDCGLIGSARYTLVQKAFGK